MNEEEFQELCQKHLEGIAGEEESLRFAAILQESARARELYVGQMRLHARLARMFDGPAETAIVPPVIAFPKQTRVKRPWAWSAAALLILSLAGGMWMKVRTEGKVGVEVVAASGGSYRAGEFLKRDRIEIGGGSLVLRLASGAVLELSGPTVLDLIDPMHVRLLDGNLTTEVGELAKGFVVETQEARLVDLGTRFGVSAGPAKTTDVAVFQGRVEVYQPGASGAKPPAVTLGEGEAVRVDSAGKSRRLTMVEISDNARLLGRRKGSEIVSAMTDNVPDIGFRGYYGVVRGGMGEGSRIYTTAHQRTWHAMSDEPFPGELTGADVVCTFSNDRHNDSLEIEMTVDQPCEVYVIADSRVPIPQWIREGFVDTGLTIQSGPWPYAKSPEGEPLYRYAVHAVWKKRITQPGVVKLGPTTPFPDGRKSLMYGIAVKKLL